jgi:hypothetical protein
MNGTGQRTGQRPRLMLPERKGPPTNQKAPFTRCVQGPEGHWPLVPEKPGQLRVWSGRRDAVGWVMPGKDKLEGKTIMGLRNAGAAPIVIDALCSEVLKWWQAPYAAQGGK